MMVQLTVKPRIFVVKNIFATKSYVDVRCLFQKEFRNELEP